jgi:hypothetical protein
MANANGEPTFLEMLRNVVVTYKGTVGDPVSLADISKIARVEPITLISSNLTGTKELYNILHGVLNIYAAFYLQAVHILSAQLSDVRILKILDKTNPDRDMKTLLTSGYTAYESLNVKTLSLENCKYKLPMLGSEKPSFVMESIFDEDSTNSLGNSTQKLETFEKLGSAVGKVMEVKFTVRGNDSKASDEITIPVVVKLDNMVIPADVIDQILTANSDEITLGSRFKDAISGRIGFIKDFILCSDLIKTQKKTMIKDPTGYYNQLMKRINNSRMYSALSGNISLAGVSSIVVISEEDESYIQKQIGGKLTNEHTREIIFNNTSAMMIVVVDKEWERVSIYVKDIDGFSQNSFDAFKSMSDKGNNNIADIIKAFSLNNAPSF